MNSEPITTNNILQLVIMALFLVIVAIIYHYQKQREYYKNAYLAHKKKENQKFKEMKSELFISVGDYKNASDEQILNQLTNVVAKDLQNTNNLKVGIDYTYIQSGRIRLVLNHNVHVH